MPAKEQGGQFMFALHATVQIGRGLPPGTKQIDASATLVPLAFFMRAAFSLPPLPEQSGTSPGAAMRAGLLFGRP
ncbi:hypothetical protein F2P45_20710 [Massilia sp. CCM 8733]|uniref:Uncharacterized protein n=1 Tax=Massilia mucilaginosa TaxID=2609282 RepID=A0ABX0NXB6_9BURK|nr:hypothetical protein [Massilia mucilaginosa]NHZ91409.1 hypothetical protein [Massilia mucilaginosa]